MRGGVGCGQACCVVVQDVAMSAAPTDPDRWSDLDAELHRWRQAHPDATFAELEVAVDAHLDALRATVLSELATEAPARGGALPPLRGAAGRPRHPYPHARHTGGSARTLNLETKLHCCL